VRDHVLTIAAVAQARGGDIPGALETLKRAERGRKAEAYGKIAAMQIKAGDKAGANMAVKLAVEATENDLYFQSRGLRDLAKAMAKEGYYEGAKEIFALAVELIKKERNHYGSPYLCAMELSDIAEAQLNAGDASAARSTARLAFETAREVPMY